ncbi:MAG: hypothetical protein LBD60_02380, partial [Puniceicoccales bacterium]|nr:hypothetical protein [Puniceicoccales bacterium]
MKDKYTKKMLIGMMFLSSNLYHNTVRASFLPKILWECPVGSLEQPLDQCNKGRFLCRQPSKNAVWIFFKQQTPNRSQTELVEAVRDKKTDTAMRILLLNSICPTIDNHGGVLNYLLHVAIQNDDILTLGALLNARYRDENGNERRLFDVNYEHNGLTP